MSVATIIKIRKVVFRVYPPLILHDDPFIPLFNSRKSLYDYNILPFYFNRRMSVKIV
jgi:hypothetical protein